ncbi:hypothetical protein MN608_04000 [Microdochium nivale]|nr:hypothetical protein MN608_04000 [Microdochium nivale]
MAIPSSLNPFYEFDPEDNTGILAIVAITSQIISALTLIGRLACSKRLFPIQAYDAALLLAFGALTAQTCLTVYAAQQGLGKHAAALTEVVLDRIRKAQYAVWLLSITVVASTKICLCLFVHTINTFAGVRVANLALQGLVGLFFVSGLFATAFRCPIPTPWLAETSATCPAAGHVYLFILVANIITDVLVCIIATVMIAKVQTNLRTKAIVISLFVFRLACPVTTAPALSYPKSHICNGNISDFTWESMSPSLWWIVSCNLSVVTACVPTLKKFFDSLLGNTYCLKIDGPYKLERVQGNTGFHIAELDEARYGTACCDHDGRHLGLSGRFSRPVTISRASVVGQVADGKECEREADHGSKISPAGFFGVVFKHGKTSLTALSAIRTDANGRGAAMKALQGKSDSVKGLTDGIIMVRDEVDIRWNGVGSDDDDLCSISRQ